MSAPLRRSRDPEPLGRGWEIAFVAVAAVLGVVVLAALVGAGLAATWWGGGWVWPATAADVGSAVRGFLVGRPGDGYPDPHPDLLPARAVTYVAIAVSEVVHVSVLLFAAVMSRRHFGTGGRSGMATRSEAERALGISQLRTARSVIRPDMHRG